MFQKIIETPIFVQILINILLHIPRQLFKEGSCRLPKYFTTLLHIIYQKLTLVK